MLVNLARRDIILAGEGDVKVTFVVAEVEVNFTSVVKYEDFSMPFREMKKNIIINLSCRKIYNQGKIAVF